MALESAVRERRSRWREERGETGEEIKGAIHVSTTDSSDSTMTLYTAIHIVIVCGGIDTDLVL